MGTWMDFILERYNYWVVIILMMIGLYTVFARGNLVKKIVGLNLFQTSVFIFYITIGKIAGGTAPIYVGGELDHGGGHGDDTAGGDHGAAAAHGEVSDHGAETAAHDVSDASEITDSLHGKIDNAIGDAPLNDLKDAVRDHDATGAADNPSLHDAPVGDGDKISNTALLDAKPEATPSFDVATDHGEETAHHVAETAHAVSEVIYTNPLPHVLILTAIVVGVATTAVGLALAVRIREAYGTIEEDELEAIDDVAEFGAKKAAGGTS